MKRTSALLVLVLAAAFPAAAAIKPGERCDTAFLEMVVADSEAGRAIIDRRVENRSVNGVVVSTLKFNEVSTCDSATWRYLAEGTPLAWRNADAGRYWEAGNAGANAALLLMADDFFKAIDPKAAEVLAAADAVIEAGVQLGVIATSDTSESLTTLLKGASGGEFGRLKPQTVTLIKESQQEGGPALEQLGPVLRKLQDETGEYSGVSGGGESVLRFRLAVLALNAELGRLGASSASVVKRAGGALPETKDFMPALPSGYVLPEIDKTVAQDDDKYEKALAALIGTGARPRLGDSVSRPGALLEPVDLGLRNLVAVRSLQVDIIVAAAGRYLSGQRISQFVERTRRNREDMALPENSLNRAVLDRLSDAAEYENLDGLYEMNWRERGDVWVNSPAGREMAEVRGDMRAAALSARIEKVDGRDTVVFRLGGTKRDLSGLVPSIIDNDPDERDTAARHIARLIIEESVADVKYQAVVAAITGAGRPGGEIDTGLRGPEKSLSRIVPPGRKECDGEADGRGRLLGYDCELYVARQRAAAAEMAGASVLSRNAVERWRLEALAASDALCKEKQDARILDVADALMWCVLDKKAIEDLARAKIKELNSQ